MGLPSGPVPDKIAFGMIARMREPVDQFGRRLRELRKARGLAANELSAKARVSRTFVSKWEREPRIVNKAILQRVAAALNLSEAEHAELSRLAVLRQVPDELKDQLTPHSDPDSNLLTALLEIDHEWPSEPPDPNPRSERTQLLLDAVAWPLIFAYAASEYRWGPQAWHLQWPETIARLWHVREEKNPKPRIYMPEAILREEAPFLDQIGDARTLLDATTQSIGMARVYRRALFADLDRTRALVSDRVKFWAYDRLQHLAESATLESYTPDATDAWDFADVSCRVAAFVGERDVARSLWYSLVAFLHDPWHCEWQAFDWLALQTIAMADTRILKHSFWDRQHVRDALFIFHAESWAEVTYTLRSRFGDGRNTKNDLESQLEAGVLEDDMRRLIAAEPWRVAAVDRQLLIRYLKSKMELVPEFAETGPVEEAQIHKPSRGKRSKPKAPGKSRSKLKPKKPTGRKRKRK